MYMKKYNIADLRNNMKDVCDFVAEGEEVYITRRNVPFAKIIPFGKSSKNSLKFGSMKGSVKVSKEFDLTEPVISQKDWGVIFPK